MGIITESSLASIQSHGVMSHWICGVVSPSALPPNSFSKLTEFHGLIEARSCVRTFHVCGNKLFHFRLLLCVSNNNFSLVFVCRDLKINEKKIFYFSANYTHGVFYRHMHTRSHSIGEGKNKQTKKLKRKKCALPFSFLLNVHVRHVH